MRTSGNSVRVAVCGFSLVELAVVMTIVAFLLGGLLYTLSAQTEQRSFEETRRRLDQARELLLSFALVNGRLPCPARYVSDADHSSGRESFCTAATGGCTVTTTLQTHGRCSNGYDGFLPAVTIGFQAQDRLNLAVDPWGNRLRYAVSATTWQAGSTARFTRQHVSSDSTAAWTITTTPADLVICGSATGMTSTTCNTAPSVTNQNVVVATVFSTGKNGALTPCATCADEIANRAGNATFVYHPPTPLSSNEFDDQFTWITVGELYSKLIAAGVLP